MVIEIFHKKYISVGVGLRMVVKQNGGCHGYAHLYRVTTSIFSCPEDPSRTPNGFRV